MQEIHELALNIYISMNHSCTLQYVDSLTRQPAQTDDDNTGPDQKHSFSLKDTLEVIVILTGFSNLDSGYNTNFVKYPLLTRLHTKK